MFFIVGKRYNETMASLANILMMKEEKYTRTQKEIDDFHIKQLKEILLGTYNPEYVEKEPIVVKIEDLPMFKKRVRWEEPLIKN